MGYTKNCAEKLTLMCLYPESNPNLRDLFELQMGKERLDSQVSIDPIC